MDKILLIEDDIEISTMLKNFLTTENFEVVTAYDGENACEKFFADNFSLVLLDLMIPKMNGIEVMGKIRESHTVPIIILSAKDTDSDKTLGLGLGADDYITKPFGVMELISRVRALLRRAGQETSQSVLTLSEITLDTASRICKTDEKPVELTFKEFELLALLMRNAGIVLSRDVLMEQIWGIDFISESRTLDVHIKSLRKKLGTAGKHIHTVRNVGYVADGGIYK